MVLYQVRGQLELERGRPEEALSALQAADRLAGTPVTPNTLAPMIRAQLLLTLLRLGQAGRAEAALAGLDARDRQSAEMRIALASLRLAQHEPQAETAALAPVIDGSVTASHPNWLVTSLQLEAMARDALGDPAAAGRALERALDLAEPNHVIISFLLSPAPPGLLERHARDCARHAALVAEILSLLPAEHGEQKRPGGMASPHAWRDDLGQSPPRLIDPLTKSEIRVLRYLPTNLSAPEIARELSVSVNTVRTHVRHLSAKLGTHRRTEAVAHARALGLLAPSPHKSRSAGTVVGVGRH